MKRRAVPPRAVIGRANTDGWQGQQVGGTPPEPWMFGERLLSKVIRYRGDLEGFLDGLFTHDDKAWDRVGEPSGLMAPAGMKPADWLYLFDLAARTLTIHSGDGETFLVIQFNERGRASPMNIERPPAPWAGIPVVDGWQGAEWLEEMETVCTEVPPDDAVGVGLADRLPDDPELWVIWPRLPDAAYWTVKLGAQTLHYPSQAWRQATGWAQRSPNVMTLWRPPYGELDVSLTPSQLCEEVGLDEWAYELIKATWFARGGLGELIYADQPFPMRRWDVVTQVRDPERELQAKGKKRKAGRVESRPVDCAGWQWQVLDWLRWGQLQD